MQKIPLSQSRGIGAWQTDWQIDPKRHSAAGCHRAQPGEERWHIAHRHRCGKPPYASFVARNGDPAFARIDAPVRVCGDGGAMPMQ